MILIIKIKNGIKDRENNKDKTIIFSENPMNENIAVVRINSNNFDRNKSIRLMGSVKQTLIVPLLIKGSKNKLPSIIEQIEPINMKSKQKIKGSAKFNIETHSSIRKLHDAMLKFVVMKQKKPIKKGIKTKNDSVKIIDLDFNRYVKFS